MSKETEGKANSLTTIKECAMIRDRQSHCHPFEESDPMTKFCFPWSLYGAYEIEAETLEQAEKLVSKMTQSDIIALSEKPDFELEDGRLAGG